MTSRAHNHNKSERRSTSAAVGVALAVIGTVFALASTVHFGVTIALGFATVSDPSPGAALAEAVVAAVVLVGAVAVLTRRRSARGLALTSTLFAILATGYGLTLTIASARTGDIAYHLIILVALLATLGSLLARGARRRMD